MRLPCLLFLLSLCLGSVLHAAPLTVEQVPEPLKPWTGWVLQNEKNYQCPFLHNNFQQKHCSWPGRLQLEIDDLRGHFDSGWRVYRQDWITLPGNDKHWPQNVKANDKPVAVMKRHGKPVLRLEPGEYRITGQFFWDHIPDNLAIPRETGLLSLTVNGKSIPFPTLKKGAVWLKDSDTGRKKPESVQNRLDLQVFRKVFDGVPLQLITYLELQVSGEQREIKLPHALLKSFIPIALNSPLPARLEGDGSLLLQVRPGRWHVELNARHPEPLTKLTFAVNDAGWPEAEIWVFQAHPHLRLVEIENLTAIDPSQTNLPGQWRNLPAYRVNQGDSMVFKVIRRGDPEPEPNQLSLFRTLWLDFDGGGYSVEDKINGKMTSGWRLNARPDMQLGQVQMNGQNQLITRLQDSEQEGIEVRKGALQIKADSRLTGEIGQLNAVGWQQDFQQVRAELNLPPGWRLLAVGGVDNDPNSWISRWTLLDLFLVLIAALAISRLWNLYWGLFALFSLALIWHEPDAPRFVWLNILAAVALLRVLPAGRMRHFIKWYRNIGWLALLLIAIPFMVDQVRVGLYPQLEKQWLPISPQPTLLSMTDTAQEVAETAADSIRMAGKSASVARKSYAPQALREQEKAVEFDRIDPDAKLQTGPGLPQWQWHKIQLSWNGRVDRSQQLELWLVPPAVTMLLNFVRVALLLLLSLLMFGMLNNKLKLSMPTLSLLLLATLVGTPEKPAYAGFPSEQMLNELKSRLLEAPDCVPSCAQIADMRIDIEEQTMSIRLQVHAEADSAVPLPAQYEQWYPARVKVDGEQAQALMQHGDGKLWLSLPQGRHEVEMQGLNPLNHQFTLPLPLKPHWVELESEGWSVEGLHENGQTAGQLQFTRIQNKQHKELTTLQPSILPPFIRIERTLRLGLDWRIDTRVIRVEQSGAPVVLEYPLLPGESVTSANIRVKDRRVLVNMPAGQRTLSWQSALEKSERIELQAASNELWTEVWRADVSPIWHLETSGIAVVHHQDRGRWLPEWRPWPGEKVGLLITRPEAVAGETLTIDKTELQIKPGKRSQEAQLQLHVRSSKGTQHNVELPGDAVLQSVMINAITQPIRQQGRIVTLPIQPGTQQITLKWHENKEQENWLTTPKVNLNLGSVNSHIRVIVGHDRWVLFTFGPKFGPAALIWGVLIVLALLSFGLGKVRWTPLKHWQWFLLLVGLSQIPVAAGLLVVFWLIALGIRREKPLQNPGNFNFMQVTLAGLSLIALLLLFYAVQQGLLGSPDMQIAGNQSTAFNLNWYQDRNASTLPTATVVSAPLFVYRILMLLWSLWLAVSLLDWLKWGWQCFSSGGLWKKREEKKQETN